MIAYKSTIAATISQSLYRIVNLLHTIQQLSKRTVIGERRNKKRNNKRLQESTMSIAVTGMTSVYKRHEKGLGVCQQLYNCVAIIYAPRHLLVVTVAT